MDDKSTNDNSLEDKRILIADADSFMARLLKDILDSSGVGRVLVARTFDEATSILASINFDCIFLDWMSSADTGQSLVKYIRGSDQELRRGVPIILCTGHTEIEQIMKARDEGVSEIVVKPIAPDQVLEKLQNAIFRKRRFIAAEASAGKYVGPDRRRKRKKHKGGERRKDQKLDQAQIDKVMAKAPKQDQAKAPAGGQGAGKEAKAPAPAQTKAPAAEKAGKA
ncbi:MAG: response regulator [Sphingomonadales bacterium]